MNMPTELNVRAFWGGRVEPIQTQAAMVWDCWQRLAARGGLFVAPWCRVGGGPVQEIGLPTQDALLADMSQSCDAKGPYYSFWQSTEASPEETQLRVNLNAYLALPKIYPGGIGNKAILAIDPASGVSGTVPVAWLLGIGRELVRDFVDVWHPDVVEFDSLELIRMCPKADWPTVGYVTWLAPWVVEERKLPRAPIREEYRGGTLIGIAPDSKDLLGDATRLARKIYRSGALKPLPTVQPQPGDA